ncbi:MAG TPA: VTT domain-containing protein [Kofleriaceae bacterium]|nr:VTT domain-containing protein [Kofleriaceae bacterium]
MTQNLLDTLGLYGATFAFCFIAALVPLVVNVELYLIGITTWAVQRPEQLLPIIVLAAVGQMAAKTMIYFAGMGMIRLPRSTKSKEKIERARAYMERWQTKPYWFFSLSAVFGLPPFYLTCLVAGALKIRIKRFLALGLAGRLVRFAAIVLVTWMM